MPNPVGSYMYSPIKWQSCEAFLARNILTAQDVMIKLESLEASQHYLEHEYWVYQKLSRGIGIPRACWFGTEGGFNAMVLNCLGHYDSAMNSRAHGASVGGTKALGGWNESGSFRNCYDHAFSVDALLGAASFNAQKPEEYFLARDKLDPPADVMAYLFPWVDAELTALNGHDCALLYAKYPDSPIFHYAPFKIRSFTAFSANVTAIVTAAQEEAQLAFHTLPDHMARSMHGYATDLQIRQELNHSKLWDELQELQKQNEHLKMLVSSSKGLKHKTPVMPPPPTVPSPAAPPPPGVGVKPSAPVATDLPTPILPSSSLPAIIINFSGLPTNPSVSATSPSASTIFPSPVSQPVASLAPPALPPATFSDDDRKLAQWKALTNKFDEWLYEADYVPLYHFQPVTKICDIWTEWSTELNGFLPVRNLNEGWGARWQQGWNLALAQRFLHEKYEGTTTPRKFCDYIQKNNGAGLQEVLQAASHYSA
ncbi:hypothetical protein EI94DRAFT_1696523 [Lactarius quietus]|nr:hypothetical protein EI94DRAFT_1696523 [Lactarius quietus]